MLTPEQRIARKQHLGASDVAALFGLDPFKTGADVWLSKVADVVEPEVQSDAVDIGNDFEAPLIAWAAKELGVEVSTEPDDLFGICKEHPVLAATLDARILPKSKREAIEAKTSSMDGDDSKGKDNEWGEPNTDQIPARVILQCQQQMLCHDLDRVHVVALLGRMGLKRQLYRVERNEKIIQAIVAKSESFWNTYVLTKTPPPEDAFGLGSLDIIRRVVRVPQTWAEVPDELVEAWENARAARLEAEKVEKEALSRILTPLGDAEGVQLRDGRVLTYYPTVKKILDQKRIKSEYPEIYEACQKESVSRTPRIKKEA